MTRIYDQEHSISFYDGEVKPSNIPSWLRESSPIRFFTKEYFILNFFVEFVILFYYAYIYVYEMKTFLVYILLFSIYLINYLFYYIHEYYQNYTSLTCKLQPDFDDFDSKGDYGVLKHING